MATHQEVVARFFGQGDKDFYGSRMLYDGDTRRVYSFGYHFPLAALHQGASTQVVLVPDTTPSSYTSRHRQLVAVEARARGVPCFFVANHLRATFRHSGAYAYNSQPVPDESSLASHDAHNLGVLLASAAEQVTRITIMRGDFLVRATWHLTIACDMLHRATAYADAFGCHSLLPPGLPAPTPRAVLRWVFPLPPNSGLARRNVAMIGDLASDELHLMV